MSSLRTTQPSVTNSRLRQQGIDNPPSFYDDDIKKKMDKYSKVIKERAQFKRQYFSNERKTILAGNDNFVEADADKKIAEVKYTGGQIQATRSEFKKVV